MSAGNVLFQLLDFSIEFGFFSSDVASLLDVFDHAEVELDFRFGA